jgi:hypothetical protein
MDDKTKLILGVTALVVLVAVCFVSYQVGYRSGASGTAAIQAKLDEVKKFFPPLPEDSKLLSGYVESVSGDVITVKTTASDPFNGSSTFREVVVASTTKIIQSEPKPSRPNTEKEISVSDIKTGVPISVEAASSIKNAARFDAVKITIYPNPAVPPPTVRSTSLPSGTAR